MIQPFTIHVSQAILDDLSDRLARTRWPGEVCRRRPGLWLQPELHAGALRLLAEKVRMTGHKKGQSTSSLTSATRSVASASISSTRGGDVKIQCQSCSCTAGPSSFWQMLKIIPLLTDHESHRGEASDSFDVIVPDLSCYGFFRPAKGERRVSFPHRRPVCPADDRRTGIQALCSSRHRSRYRRTLQLGLAHSNSIIGLPLSGANPRASVPPPEDLSKSEKKFVADIQNFWAQEGAYSMMHSTKPQTLAYGLNDSPAGLAAWIVEKFRAWSDCDGDVEKRFTKDELLTN